MPLDVLGRTRATLTEPTSTSPWPEGLGNLVKLCRAGDRALQLLLFNEEFLVSASHQLALITSLPFVHTARRYYRLNGLVRLSDSKLGDRQRSDCGRKVSQTWSFRGSKSRNKVSVGEPAEGSLNDIAARHLGELFISTHTLRTHLLPPPGDTPGERGAR
jgi:hypothetical protein